MTARESYDVLVCNSLELAVKTLHQTYRAERVGKHAETLNHSFAGILIMQSGLELGFEGRVACARAIAPRLFSAQPHRARHQHVSQSHSGCRDRHVASTQR